MVGMENYCERPSVIGGGGLGCDGGMADYLLVPPSAASGARCREGLDPVVAAPLTDAGLTPYHAIRRSWPKLTPDATCVLIGVGGLGHVAVQIARATTAAQVIAVDVKPEALELARKVGAHHAVLSNDTAGAAIRELTGGRGADVVIDFRRAPQRHSIWPGRSHATMGDVTIVGHRCGEVPAVVLLPALRGQHRDHLLGQPPRTRGAARPGGQRAR